MRSQSNGHTDGRKDVRMWIYRFRLISPRSKTYLTVKSEKQNPTLITKIRKTTRTNKNITLDNNQDVLSSTSSVSVSSSPSRDFLSCSISYRYSLASARDYCSNVNITRLLFKFEHHATIVQIWISRDYCSNLNITQQVFGHYTALNWAHKPIVLGTFYSATRPLLLCSYIQSIQIVQSTNSSRRFIMPEWHLDTAPQNARVCKKRLWGFPEFIYDQTKHCKRQESLQRPVHNLPCAVSVRKFLFEFRLWLYLFLFSSYNFLLWSCCSLER